MQWAIPRNVEYQAYKQALVGRAEEELYSSEAARYIKRLRCNVFLSLCRRNEMLLANKPTIVRQAAATAGPEEEKIKKFATAIVEFSKVKSD